MRRPIPTSRLGAFAIFLALGCGAGPLQSSAPDTLTSLRKSAAAASDDSVGRLALLEMFAPGGTADGAATARRHLEQTSHRGMWALLACAIWDDAHGDPGAAADGYAGALAAASRTSDERGPLVGWFATRHLIALRGSIARLYDKQRALVEGLLTHPGRIGWRAVAELEDWRALEVYDRAELSGSAYDADVVRRMGCAKSIRIAGPFGRGAASDADHPYPAEDPVPWPSAWPPDPIRGTTPHVLPVTQARCMAVADEQVQDGVFYVETYFDTGAERELLIAVQGAGAIWIDGTRVLSRSVQSWGSWQRFGAHVLVSEGRHRVLARTMTAGASIRLLNPDGTAAALETDADPRRAVSLTPPQVLSDLNPLDPIVAKLIHGDEEPAPAIDLMLSAYAAHADQADDVASAILEPLVEPQDAGGLALEMASSFASSDPALPDDVRNSRSQSLRTRALARDPRLWRLRAAGILDGADEHGLTEAVEPMRALVREVDGQPELREQLAQLYGRLGWKGDQLRVLEALSQRFPDDANGLRAYLEVLDDVGPPSEAQRVAQRLRQLDPDSEVDLDRALARQDYSAAKAELARLRNRRPERKDIANRLADVLLRAGDPDASSEALNAALSKHPRDAEARFRLADRAFAREDTRALRNALAAALEAHAPTESLRSAIDLVENATNLEPFRRDGLAIIRAFQAWEKAGHHMDGTAARVLDYSAIWVNDDGSSEMLEHEIQKIQSQEAATNESETELPGGLVLHLRVIKPDGTVLEPEPVAGKPTLTMPNLEVGDFIESEHITSQASDGVGGRRFESPLWFFREADKGYWQSEFVVVTPADRELDIEKRGDVPPPQTTPLGAFVQRRWRVELSPPAELEPDSPVITEFLPSVRVGWGVSMKTTLPRLIDLAADTAPLDPRLRRLALQVVAGVPAEHADERASLLYRWVLGHIQEGKESDGRRTIFGRTGSRQSAYRYMLRLLGIDSDLAIVKDRLTAPALGGMSEIDSYDALALRVATERGPRWLTVRDKFAPFGYVPSELRDQQAIVLSEGAPTAEVEAPAAPDDLTYEGRVQLHPDGSALLDLTVTFEGARAIGWRGALEQIPTAKLQDFVERQLVAPALDGAHVRSFKTLAASEPDKPLVMQLTVDVPEFAKPINGGLLLHPPLTPNLAQLASLPVRRTAMLRRAAWRLDVRLQVDLPKSMRVVEPLNRGEVRNGGALVAVRDVAKDSTLLFDRTIDLPAERVEAGPEYAAWAKFIRDAGDLVSRETTLAP